MDRTREITRDELITSNEYLLGNIQYELYDDIKQYLLQSDMNQTEFATKLGVSKGYISQILNGDFDHKVSKLISLYKGIGIAVTGLQKIKIEEYLASDRAFSDRLELKQVDYLDFEPEQDLELIPLDNVTTIEQKLYINESRERATAA